MALPPPQSNGIDIRERGAVADGVTNNYAAIEKAIADAATLGGGVIRIPSHTNEYATSGGHAIPPRCVVLGDGPGLSKVKHTGNNTCFSYTDASYGVRRAGRIEGLTLRGNPGASAVGISAQDSYGFAVRSVSAYEYSAGVAFQIFNVVDFTEGAVFEHCHSWHNLIGWRFKCTSAATSTSHNETHLVRCAINVPLNGIGIDIGGGDTGGSYVYNCYFQAQIWLEGNNAIGIKLTRGGAEKNTWDVKGETSTATYTGLNAVSVFAGGVFLGRGDIFIMNTAAGLYGLPIPSTYGAGADVRVAPIEYRTNIIQNGARPVDLSGLGTPEGAVAASPGSTFRRLDGGAGTIFYVKESGGSSNTGWVAK